MNKKTKQKEAISIKKNVDIFIVIDSFGDTYFFKTRKYLDYFIGNSSNIEELSIYQVSKCFKVKLGKPEIIEKKLSEIDFD
ncbi:MAG TPA: hypothetical protein PKN54_00795 [Candidatus Cloacimonas acidaminovorans]|nr:hypothetical protein [Candidatus Cloacimonas acidaminovorans]